MRTSLKPLLARTEHEVAREQDGEQAAIYAVRLPRREQLLDHSADRVVQIGRAHV